MRIRTIIFYLATLCLLASAGCAKDNGLASNELSLKQYNYWLDHYKEQHPEYLYKPIGGYNTLICLEETKGDESKPLGPKDGTYKYIRVDYLNTDLEGNYIGYTMDTVAKQLGEYDRRVYCSSRIIYRGEQNVQAGLNIVLANMNEGGTVKYISPGWLNTYNYHDTEQQYIDNERGTHMIGSLKVIERIHNVVTWEVDSIGRYVEKNYGMTPADSTKYGFYLKVLVPPVSQDDTLSAGNTYYINYIGRLLNGQVFDTSIADTAKKYGIYDASATYGPVSILYSKNASDVTMGGSEESTGGSVVNGFGTIITKLHKKEKLKGVFFSGLGYDYDGKSPSIPPYCPLEFEVEYVEK